MTEPLQHGEPTTLPTWAMREVEEFEKDSTSGGWEDSDPFHEEPRAFARTVGIVYPSQIHFVVEALSSEGWVSHWNDKTYATYELAEAAARRKAYQEQKPHRIRQVVWKG